MPDLLQWGLSNALAAAALAAVVALPALVLRRRRPAVVHALWLIVLVKLVTPPLWKVPVSWPATEPKSIEVVHAAASNWASVETAAEEIWVSDAAPEPTPPPPTPPSTADWLRLFVTAAISLWLAGSISCLTLIATRSVRFHRLLRHASPAPPEVRRRAETIAVRFGLRGAPTVWFVPGAVCPMLWAIFGSARLLLPRGLWDRLDSDQRDTLVAHELAHLRRRDHWVRLVEVAATVLYWWHPVLWWARRQMRDAEEQCCDAWVVWSMPTPAGVRHYMSAILEAVEFVSQPNPGGRSAPPAVPALASGMGEFRRLERRLWMIRRNESPRRLGRPGIFAVLLAAAAALPLAPTLARDDSSTVEEEKQVTREVTITTSADAPVTASGDVSVSVIEGELPATASADTIRFVKDEDVIRQKIYDARTGSTVVMDGKEVRIVAGDDLEQARAEVEQLSAALAQAKQRLKELEKGKRANGNKNVDAKWESGTATRRLSVKPADPRVKSAPSADWVSKPDKEDLRRDDDQQRRLEKLEQKLDKLDQLLDEMREMRDRERKERNDLKGPRPN